MELEENLIELQIEDRTQSVSTPPPDDQIENQSPPVTVDGTGRKCRRSGRIRINPVEVVKQRAPPKLKRLSADSSLNDIMKYYTHRSVKILHPSLETIYEEPQMVKGQLVMMSNRKLKRVISFPDRSKPTKVKRRGMKAKAMSAIKRANNKKITMDFLMKKLADLD